MNTDVWIKVYWENQTPTNRLKGDHKSNLLLHFEQVAGLKSSDGV